MTKSLTESKYGALSIKLSFIFMLQDSLCAFKIKWHVDISSCLFKLFQNLVYRIGILKMELFLIKQQFYDTKLKRAPVLAQIFIWYEFEENLKTLRLK